MPVKFQSDWKSLNPNLAASRLHEILRGKTAVRLVNRGPEWSSDGRMTSETTTSATLNYVLYSVCEPIEAYPILRNAVYMLEASNDRVISPFTIKILLCNDGSHVFHINAW